jgi:hypothetical protein
MIDWCVWLHDTSIYFRTSCAERRIHSFTTETPTFYGGVYPQTTEKEVYDCFMPTFYGGVHPMIMRKGSFYYADKYTKDNSGRY